ncbi:glycine zipper 2TM domain-containing protein [Paraglaciecola aquimarina]|uniref:Glycine zipper 2TM domain-containing protein n=1 Tax=Paraglaciecola aquimarina TaxID=1235557 RepID=A0ABU3T0S6_9ALTE|nr:glycine zipper 2TM domain-containing protein [Paraglaciecola aquimarina]MDU0355874.1 glycine zipper 2TM domain-containing protein [Paraglaciecola aquimarina]
MKPFITVAVALLLISPFASANYQPPHYKARVVNITPVYEYILVNRHHPRSTVIVNKRHNCAAIGSIIGGSLGHMVSDKKHKIVGTIAGAIMGGAIGHKIDNTNRQDRYTVVNPRQPTLSKQRVLRGYKVSYKVKGRTYQTFSKTKPNKYIRIYH